MKNEKLVPHMTDIIKIFQDESILKSFLCDVKINTMDKESAAQIFVESQKLEINTETSRRYIGSLCTFHFLEDDGTLHLTKYSQQYLKGDLSYPNYILSCLSLNLEWSYFLPDLLEIIEESKSPLKKSGLIDELEKKDYDISNKATIGRYLGEILPMLDIANVISYENNQIRLGKRNRQEILDYARFNQRELLNLLRLAERRVGKPTLRRIYRATIKAYLPLKKNRNIIINAQKEIDEIRKMVVRKSGKKDMKPFDSKWKLNDALYDWQKSFLDLWFKEKKGIAEVVTGAGKTHLAMAIIEQLKKKYDDLHVTIIVPTIVLLEQWNDNLVKKLQISPNEIGLKGGGHSDTFEGKKILIVVINSAIKSGFVERETMGIKHNLFIVDECHRAGASEFRKIFSANRNWELGLSATPEREMDNAYEEVLVKNLGDKIGSYTYNDALDDGIIPRFDIYNYAVILTNGEKIKYMRLTKEIQKTVQRLKFRYPHLNNPKRKMEVVLKALQKKYPKDRDLFLYFQKTKERKNDILFPAANRKNFVRMILDRILNQDDESVQPSDSPISNIISKDRAIVFHEKIDEINSLFLDLNSVDVSIYHSGFPNSLNRIGLDLYKSGQTKVLLSVKALIEGVDVPKTNVGIIMASSSSQTQRIQSLGRVLRRAKGKDQTKLFIAYVKNTTDERIYHSARKNWDTLIGKGNIEFKMWTEFGEVNIDPPELASKKSYIEIDKIDESTLAEGCKYPGKYEGEHYSFDSNGRLFKKTAEGRLYISENVEKLWIIFQKYKPTGGRILINELGHMLIKFKKDRRFETIYLGNINKYIDDFKKLFRGDI
jgi:superfamily II DNA or RNA helicase